MSKENAKNKYEQVSKALKALCGLELEKTGIEKIDVKCREIESTLLKTSQQDKLVIQDFYWEAIGYLYEVRGECQTQKQIKV